MKASIINMHSPTQYLQCFTISPCSPSLTISLTISPSSSLHRRQKGGRGAGILEG